MATSIFPILVAFHLLLAATASARPCKTIFFFSATTTTTSFYPFNPHHGNPNPNPNSLPRAHFTLIFTTTSRFPILRPSIDSAEDSRSSPPSDSILQFFSAVSSSIRDRSRDIITVVAALAAMLLGAGCGFLSAGAVYLVYVILSRRRRRASVDDVESCSSDDDDDIAMAKMSSYLPIPSVDDDLKKPAKEVF